MITPDNKTPKPEPVPKASDIKFNGKMGTLLIGVDKKPEDIANVRAFAEKKGLLEKDEIHLTVIGSDTAEAIMASLKQLSPDKQAETLSKIKALADGINWKFNLDPEFYYIKKEYNDPDPNNPAQTIPETRESIVQTVKTENLAEFYGQLKKITGLEFETPLPHVTLFTTSTREDKKKRGIGIYSQKDFVALNPEKLGII